MLDEANANVPRISPEDAKKLAARPTFWSLTCASRRKSRPRAWCRAPSPCRGLVEFRANPASAMQDRHSIAPRPPSPTAPRAGARRWSAAMGYDKVLSLGGFKGWVDAGGEAEKG